MSFVQVVNPYQPIVGLTGIGLNGGALYIGVDGSDPETDPQDCFWDEAGTIPATQPIDILGGYPMRLGTPTRVYTSATYSIRVRDRQGQQVFYEPHAVPGGSALIGVYATVADLQAANLPAVMQAFGVTLLGYYTAFDYGGGPYKYATVQAAGDGKVQSADGAWWELAAVEPYVEMFGATGNGVTDDRAAIQAAISFCIAYGIHVLHLGPSTFRIDGTLKVQPAGVGFKSLAIKGANGSFLGVTKLQHAAGQLLNPLMNVQSMRSVVIEDIAFYGNNTNPSLTSVCGDGTFVNGDPAAWVNVGASERRYAPYSGLTIDALTGPDPGAGANYTFGTYGQTSSSTVTINRCRFMNFIVGSAVGPRNSDSGTEDIVYDQCKFIENKYARIGTGSQQRQVVEKDCDYGGHWVNWDTCTFGTQTGQPPLIKGALINKCYRLFQVKTDIGVLSVAKLYCESVASIGIIGSAASSAYLPATFVGCNFNIIGLDDTGTVVNKDDVLKCNMPVIFTGCGFVSQFMMLVVPNRGVVFDDCTFKCEGTATDTTPGEAENFGVYAPEGREHLLTIRGNCSQRAYATTTKYLDDEVKVYSLPARAHIQPNTMRVEKVDGKVNYKLSTPGVSRTATISGVTYIDAESLSFTETTSPAIIQEGDVLFWKVLLPVLPGAASEDAMLPVLRVTDVTGTTITCKIGGRLDTSYSPAFVAVRVRQFINATESTGDTSVGSADILNVTNVTNLRGGDWIHFSNGSLTQPVRIIGIVGTTVTVHRVLNQNLIGVSIYNSRLTAL